MAERPERVDLPSGQTIWYRPEAHTYWTEYDPAKEKCSGRIPGASTAAKPLDFRPDALLKWAARSNGEGIAILAAEGLSLEEADDMRAGLSWLESAEAIWDALSEAELTYEHLRDRRAQEGTNVHERMLHALARGEKIPSLSSLSVEERGFGQAVLTWWRDRSPEPLQFEQVVYSAEHGFAGRFDLRAKVDGQTWLCDLKTGGFLSLAAHAQLAAYDLAARECGFGPSDRLLIVQVAADGTYREVDAQADHSDFVAALETYRRASELGKKARKVAKAQKQEALA